MKKLFFFVLLLSFSLVLPAQKMLLPVPYHSQGAPNNPPDSGYIYPPKNDWCTVACLHMLFDYYDHMGNKPSPFPSVQIASVCNTGNIAGGGGWRGTFQSDARRAAHFSILSNSLDGTVVGGYSWREIGYSALDDSNGVDFLNPNFGGLIGWMEALNEGYPVIFNGGFPWIIGPPEGSVFPYDSMPDSTCVGHSILLVGYDFNQANPPLSVLYFHDPFYGPNVSYMVNQLLGGWGGNYIFASPWEVKINAPDTVYTDSTFDVVASVRYTAPTLEYVQPAGPTFGRVFPVVDDPIAILKQDSCSLPLNIPNPVDSLYLIDLTQSSFSCFWSVSSSASSTYGSFRVKAVGELQPANSYSYAMYQDTIGGIVTGDCANAKEASSGMSLGEFGNYRTTLFPNPFVESNSVTLSLPKEGKVKISIFDELGREVKVLTDESLRRGQHTIPWDGTDKEGKSMPAGKYFYSIYVDGKKLPGEKAILLK